MGVLDKLLDALKINNQGYEQDNYLDDDYIEEEDELIEEDEEDDDEDDDYEEVAPRGTKGLFGKFKKENSYHESDHQEDIEYKEEEPVQEKETPARRTRFTKTNTRITPYKKPVQRGYSMEVCVIKPNSMEDAREIADTLVNGSTVILNLEGLDVDLAQRIIDFTSGACYSLNGSLQKVSSYIFILGPQNVDITGDLQNILGGGLPTVRSEY